MEIDTKFSKKERRELRRQERASEQVNFFRRRRLIKFLWWAAGAIIVIIIVGTAIWNSSRTPVSAHEWASGNENAPVTLLEYSDFQCPACAAYFPLVEQLSADFSDSLRIVFRHYPLTGIHAQAFNAALAAEASGRQGKFWEMHDKLYKEQTAWSQGDASELFARYAGELGLNLEQFHADMADASLSDKIRADQRAGDSDGVSGTPTFLLNGRKIANPSSYAVFSTLVQAELDLLPQDSVSGVTEDNGAVHEHADIKVMLRGKELDLSQDKYQSYGHDAEGNEAGEDKHPYTHLHDGKGNIVHKHKRGITLGDFFGSLDITVTNDCITLDTGEQFCGNSGEHVNFIVNGERRDGIAAYEFADLDRILVSFGGEDEAGLQTQFAGVTDEACIYSEVCPERGAAPSETCVGGLGTNC